MEVSAATHTSSLPGLRGPSPLLRLQSDKRLIALTRRGQHAAFETLCARYESRLLSFCRHMLNSREDAEDVLQEVFTAAFNAVLADEREINVRPWLYRIARNRSLNHLRRASAIGVDSMDVHFADHGLSTGDRVIRREGFRQLLSDVQQLPETQRTALLLREIDSLSYEQIAHAMETTVPSVKSLLVRARISLAEAAEARKLSCEEVRLELGQVAEGLVKLGPAARRHTRDCERCRSFKKQLKTNNHALAAIFPVGPLLIFKKLLLAKLGSTASASHVAGGAGATVGAGGAASAGAGAAAGSGAGVAGGVFTAGAGAIATKAVAGLAAAAIVTAGAVAADHSSRPRLHPAVAAAPIARTSEPVVLRQQAQPASASVHPVAFVARHRRHAQAPKPSPSAIAPVAKTAGTARVAPAPAPKPPANPKATGAQGTQITQVTSQTTQLPTSSADTPAQPPTITPTGTAATAPPTSEAEGTGTSTAIPPAPVETPPAPTTDPTETTAPNSGTGGGTPAGAGTSGTTGSEGAAPQGEDPTEP